MSGTFLLFSTSAALPKKPLHLEWSFRSLVCTCPALESLIGVLLPVVCEVRGVYVPACQDACVIIHHIPAPVSLLLLGPELPGRVSVTEASDARSVISRSHPHPCTLVRTADSHYETLGRGASGHV